ncbi:glycoside hydrolase family 25 protein [Streptococcus pacificus]|uniref:Glycoside hydrolase family 25 protein n=1 Tax=Streptococcus pacificus TaxID=2740577 RepID=A0ABS0ZGQ8_9STRE|nr:glycoside hydrolase family 25 protein [Streptococcus pacificus]MBJ8325197.1 glycoside hydrolase family 25 protein [Streptococcus pacificus]
MRKRIKPIIVVIFFGLIILFLVKSKLTIEAQNNATLEMAKNNIPKVTQAIIPTVETTEEEPFVLNPIIDLSGWQLPSDIDYDTLSLNISGAIVRVFGGSQITKKNNAAYTTGIDKSFKTHIEELQKRDVPVAVYAYALGKNVKDMKEEARLFYENASPYNPTFYWIDVEEKTMSDMNKGVEAFRQELKKLGAKNVGIYIGTYFLEEHDISTSKFDAVWIPTYGTDSGYYEAAPDTSIDYDLHQYTSRGYINGFPNTLDLNQISVLKDRKATFEKLFGKIKE